MIRRPIEAFGTSFLDLLSSALVALLIVYVIAPEDPTTPVASRSAQFAIAPDPREAVGLAVCLSLSGLRHCSTDDSASDVTWFVSERRTVVRAVWLEQNAEPAAYWVAVATDSGTLKEDSNVEVQVDAEGNQPQLLKLTKAGNFSTSGSL